MDPSLTREPMDLSDLECLKRLHALGISPEVVYDVGSSDGCWSESAMTLYPNASYVLFDPLIEHSPVYQETLTPRLARHPNWTLRPHALGQESGTIEMTILENQVGTTTLPQDGGLIGQTVTPVEVFRIDDLVSRNVLPAPSLIKIDTQGSELRILQGATTCLPDVEVLFLECWLQKAYGAPTPLFHELVEFLLPFGFRLWDFCGNYRRENGVLVSQDMVFLNVRLFRKRGVEWINHWDYPPEPSE